MMAFGQGGEGDGTQSLLRVALLGACWAGGRFSYCRFSGGVKKRLQGKYTAISSWRERVQHQDALKL